MNSWFLGVAGDSCDMGAYLSGAVGNVDLSLPARMKLDLGGGEASAGGWLFRIFDLHEVVVALPADEQVRDAATGSAQVPDGCLG